jgi:hypothetical protein
MNITDTPNGIRLCLSPLPHLWLIDIDGTIVTHNGHICGQENLLHGVKEFWQSIPEIDTIILLTARDSSYIKHTIDWLINNQLRFDQLISDMPTGERILINDSKESGLQTALALNISRNAGLNGIEVLIDANK